MIDRTPSSAEPVANDTDDDPTDYDAENFETLGCCYPGFTADFEEAPTRFGNGLQERRNVSDGEGRNSKAMTSVREWWRRTSLQEKAHSGGDAAVEIVRPQLPQTLIGARMPLRLLFQFGLVYSPNESSAFEDGHIAPIFAIRIVPIVRF